MDIDAALFPGSTVPKATSGSPVSPLSPVSQIIREISKSLSPNDIKKLYFLCIDCISSEHQCPQNLEELSSFINDDVDFVPLLKELLYHIKKYRLLKSLQTCEHQMEIALHNRKYVTQERSLLFYICENLENEAVRQLKCLLHENPIVTEGWEDVAAEDFFRIWLKDIDDKKIDLLRVALTRMKRDKLVETLSFEESQYHVITPSRGKPCGLAAIFNNEIFNKSPTHIYKQRNPELSERQGTSVDEENLCKLWTTFGFDVVVFNDTTHSSMMKILQCLTKLDYSNYSIFVCCVLTHGDQGVIFTSDNIPIDFCSEIIYRFNSTDIPSLCDKPKMFFIQACQGKGVQTVDPAPSLNLQMDGGVSSGGSSGSSNDKGDLLWMLSAIPSHMSFRHTADGSWFINSLVEIVLRSGTKVSIRDLLNSVAVDVSKKSGIYCNVKNVTQIPASTVTTFRKLRLKKLEDNVEFSQRRVRVPPDSRDILYSIYNLANAMYRI